MSLRSLIGLTLVPLLLLGCNEKSLTQASSSMEPTIKAGEVIKVDTRAFTSMKPRRWDVVVFESPIGEGQWVSRIVGLPGESVEITPTELLIDGRKEPLPAHVKIGNYRLPSTYITPGSPGPVSFPYKTSPNHYFLLGDNVSDSLDSRYWGGLDGSKIVGKVPGK